MPPVIMQVIARNHPNLFIGGEFRSKGQPSVRKADAEAVGSGIRAFRVEENPVSAGGLELEANLESGFEASMPFDGGDSFDVEVIEAPQ